MSTPTYNPAKVVIVVAGIPISGFADGTFVTCGRDNPSYSKGTGAGGEGWRAKTNDKSGTCTITLLQTSSVNAALSGLIAIDEAVDEGIGPFALKDLGGTTLYAAEDCWIEKPADSEFAREVTNREWIIHMTQLEVFVGGN